MSQKQQVLAYILDRGGEVRDENGRVASRISRVLELSSTAVSRVLNELEAEGLIVRDMPTAKSCTRVAVAEGNTVPPYKGPGALAAQLASAMQNALGEALDYTEARHQYDINQLSEEVNRLKNELSIVRKARVRLEEENAEQRRNAEFLAGQLEEARLRANRLEHNLQTILTRQPEVRGLIPESERRKLETIMKELPDAHS